MTADDQPIFQQWLAGSAELRLLIDNPHVPTMQDQLAWFANLEARNDRKLFSIVTHPDGVLIGNGGFVDIDQAKKSAMFRITIGHPEFVGKGFGTQAIRLLLAYGFNELGYKMINLSVLKVNARAIASYKKVGFIEVADSSAAADSATIRMTLDRPSFLAA